MLAVDARLFDDLSAFLADEQRTTLIEHLAAMRHRVLLADLARGLADNVRGARIPPDLLALLLAVSPEPAVLQMLDDELEEHDATVLEFYEQWYDAAIAMRSRQQLLATAQAEEASDTVVEALNNKFREERRQGAGAADRKCCHRSTRPTRVVAAIRAAHHAPRRSGPDSSQKP